VFSYAPEELAAEKLYASSGGAVESGPIDPLEVPPGESVEHWLRLHSASYDRMPDLAFELAERG